MKSFALALGAGGARGLAHIAVFEALDELGLVPTAIAGSSIGAVAGAAYAAGVTGRALRHHVLGLAHNPTEVWRRVMAARTGLDPRPHLPTYLAYNFFRIAAIYQGIVGRVRDGTATSEFAPAKAAMVQPLAAIGWRFAQQAGAQ